MMSSLGNKAASGAIWASIDRFSQMGLHFFVNLILARLLLPADFGAIGMLTIFISVSQVIIDGGFSSALIQKKAPTQIDYSTIFYWNISLSFIIYLILFLCAPLIGKFFNMPILADVLRTIGLNLILCSVVSVQTARLKKELSFKKIAITNLFSYIIASCCAIVMAYKGYGVWSLVFMQLIYSIIYIKLLWFITHWFPSFVFSKKSMRELFNFGGYIMAANVLQTLCQNLQGLIIGKKFSATQMGYYSQAHKLDQITSYSIPQVIVQVMFPVYSSIQDDLHRLKLVLFMNLRVISFLIFPILGLLIIIAEPLIVFLYGEKWVPCVPYFQVLCIGGLFVCLQNVNFYAVAAVGKSQVLFTWSFYKWGFLLCALFIGTLWGMYGILWAMVASSLNIYIVNACLTSKYVGLRFSDQLYTLLPVTLSLLVSLISSYLFDKYLHTGYVVSSLVYAISYMTLTLFINQSSVKDVKLLLSKLIYRKL